MIKGSWALADRLPRFYIQSRIYISGLELRLPFVPRPPAYVGIAKYKWEPNWAWSSVFAAWLFTPSLFTNLTSASRWRSFVLPRYQRCSWKEERQQDNKLTGGKIRRAGKCAGGHAAAGGKYGRGKVRRGSTFGYHL